LGTYARPGRKSSYHFTLIFLSSFTYVLREPGLLFVAPKPGWEGYSIIRGF
jgi:hypothetical protein